MRGASVSPHKQKRLQYHMNMKQKALILAALLAVMIVPTAAQGIFEAGLVTGNSIVRVWQDRDVVIYNEESPGVGSFLLYTVGTGTAQHIDLPADISVRDFEIMGDEVWFCGNEEKSAHPGGHAGVVGTFDIPSAFAGLSKINYTVIDIWLGSADDDMFIRSLNRLDMFVDGSDTVMAMTGDSYIYQTEQWARSTVVSAEFYRGSQQWEFHALFDKDNTAVYTDIAALDNVVTAVGTGVSGTNLLAKSFYIGLYFIHNPTRPNSADSIYYYPWAKGEALITHLYNDEAAVVQFGKSGQNELHMLDFSSGSASPYLQTRLTDDPNCQPNSPLDLKEIRFSTSTDNINVLEYGKLPGSNIYETLLWTFPRTAWHPTLVPVEPMTTVKQESMDVDFNNRPLTVGEVVGIGNLDFHSYTPGTTPIPNPLLAPDKCIDYDEISYTIDYPNVVQIPVSESVKQRPKTNNTFRPRITFIRFNQICPSK